ncbi:MAG: Dna2/Cas4 domain-containing protein, partial [Chloroflexi bacterium]|nr:Dna2/Cas4 domain-containing protein [Chloroflexota bacterium]
MIAYLLLVCALGLLVLALRLRRATGLPWTRVHSSDTSGWRQADEPLVSQRYGLVGKPDYVLETRGGLIPVEVKPSRRAAAPYESDLMQLAAYCLLIEDTTGRAPSYGLLRYAEQTFKLPYTPALRSGLLALLE